MIPEWLVQQLVGYVLGFINGVFSFDSGSICVVDTIRLGEATGDHVLFKNAASEAVTFIGKVKVVGGIEYATPHTLNIPLWEENNGSTTWSNPGAAQIEYPGLNNYTISLSGWTKAKLIGVIKANEAGTTEIIAYDTTNNQDIVSHSWSGTSMEYFETAWDDITSITGDIEITLAVDATSATEDIELRRIILVLVK